MFKFVWLDKSVSWLLELIGIELNSYIGEVLHFFIYDVIKILILLSAMIFIIAYLRSYFPPERAKKVLGKVSGVKGNILGSLLGIVTPFCSCSSVPIFIGFVSAGVDLGITFSFLITSPIVNEAALIMLFDAFGWKVALLYVISGVLIGVIGGIVIRKMKLEGEVQDYIYNIQVGEALVPDMSQKQRLVYAKSETKSILGRVFKWILIGIGIGALIHGITSDGFEEFVVSVAGPNNPFAVIVATIMGVPLYSNALGTIPISEALIEKGMAIGTALSFMMATTALSLPEVLLLKQAVKKKLIIWFLVITTIGIIITGYLFNIIIYNFI